MNDNNENLKEYDKLQNEIIVITKRRSDMLNFLITTTIVILTFIFSQPKPNPFIFLLPFPFIILISMRMAYYGVSMAKLSAYMVVFLEKDINIKWETRNSKIVKEKINGNSCCYDIFTTSRYFEGLALCIFSYVFFLYHFCINNDMSVMALVKLVFPVLLIAWEALITKRIICVNSERRKWIKIWSDLKVKENRQTLL